MEPNEVENVTLPDLNAPGRFDKAKQILANKKETELNCSIFVTTIAGNPRYTAFINGIQKPDEKDEKIGLSAERDLVTLLQKLSCPYS